jgi:succinyl-CoA synthetase alpha subunit
VPIFNTVPEAVRQTGANTSLIFVPAPFAADALLEAADAGVALIVCITEGVPVLDMVRALRHLRGMPVRVLGPNCPGLVSPGARCKVGIIPGNILTPGRVGVVSRSGTLTYEAISQLTALGMGQSTCVGIGGDSVLGTTFVDVLRLFNQDPDTEAVVLIGEIGGTKEQEAADYIKKEFRKPVAALVVGGTAPPGKRMGHAGAIITGAAATAAAKAKALREAGVHIIPTPADIGPTVAQMLRRG